MHSDSRGVLVDDQGSVSDSAAPPPSLVQRYGDGVYTTALLVMGQGDARAVDWHLHEQRLIRLVGEGMVRAMSGLSPRSSRSLFP